jgi:hypothetical protein
MVVNTETGERTKIENKTYVYLKELRGNHPSYKYKYYELCVANRVEEFLYYFPQYTDMFDEFAKECYAFVTSIHWYYVNKYIRKNKELDGKIPYRFSYHINYLHYNEYIPSVKEGKRVTITVPFIYGYFLGLPIRSILFWLNYDFIMAKKQLKEDTTTAVEAPQTSLFSANNISAIAE